MRAERFQGIASSKVASLRGLRAAVLLANQIGLDQVIHVQEVKLNVPVDDAIFAMPTANPPTHSP
ncbi:MAG: hypothetical protein DMG37_06615 [Acidobacteria bacterium]|nr:MAG: hypothetical protein DMG37_06615 [Acidobacteriota bacterium]